MDMFGVADAMTTAKPVKNTNKVFAQSFKLILKDKSEGVHIINVSTLLGLQKVFTRITKGELVELSRFHSVEMQLWGHLAEHAGMLRTQPVGELQGGLAPLGETGELMEELADMYDGIDGAINAVDTIRKLAGADSNGRGDHKVADGVVPVSDDFIEQVINNNRTPLEEAAIESSINTIKKCNDISGPRVAAFGNEPHKYGGPLDQMKKTFGADVESCLPTPEPPATPSGDAPQPEAGSSTPPGS